MEETKILYGKPVAASIREYIKKQTADYIARGTYPKAAFIRVGSRPDDIAYENRIVSDCRKLEIDTQQIHLDGDITTEELISVIEKVNKDDKCHGILLFRPLPPHIDSEAVCESIAPDKDIDCMNPVNLKKLFLGDSTGMVPCTAEAVVEILKFYGYNMTGADVTIVNRSLVIGKPLIMLMLKENATVTVCHSKTKNLKEKTSSADIFVSGVGRSEYFDDSYISPHSVVIDVGINFDKGRMCGDVDFDSINGKVKAVSPVPGGVGTVTSMLLLRHIVQAVKLGEVTGK